MPYGTGPIIRQALTGATPWQRYLIGVAMVVGGVVLVALERVTGRITSEHFTIFREGETVQRVTGGLLAVAGAFLLWRMVRGQLRRPQATPGSSPPGE